MHGIAGLVNHIQVAPHQQHHNSIIAPLVIDEYLPGSQFFPQAMYRLFTVNQCGLDLIYTESPGHDVPSQLYLMPAILSLRVSGDLYCLEASPNSPISQGCTRVNPRQEGRRQVI